MEVKSFANSVVCLAVMTLLGCGGGGGGSTSAPPSGSVTISGVAAKGPLNGADVTVYAVKADGTFDRTLGNVGTGKTSSDGTGNYSITLNSAPAGAVVVEITGGAYTDEASGTQNVKLTAPIRAIVPAVVDGDKIAVTPFTELAFKKAEGTGSAGTVTTFTKAGIDDANASVAKAFGLDNIITTLPFDSASATAGAGATAARKKYSTALGTISQMATTTAAASGGTVSAATLGAATDKLLKDLGSETLTTGGITPASLATYNNAAIVFNANPLNQNSTAITTATYSGGVLSISTSGVLSAGDVNNVINGIDMTLTLPNGVTVATDTSGLAAAGVIVLSGNAVSNSLVVSNYTPASLATVGAPATPGTLHIVLANVQPGFGTGEFMHINFLGFPKGLTRETFSPFLKGNGIVGGVANGSSTAALPGITLAISDLVGL
jgi:hypothetical protein